MLNKQHCFAKNIISQQEQRIYQTHMCGLCHALGDSYGLFSRLLTRHETILLNLLVTAQNPEEINIVERRCPLNPLIKVTTNQSIASKFSAAISVALASVNTTDHIQDSQGKDIPAVFLNSLLQKAHKQALQTLTELNFDSNYLTELGNLQTLAEQTKTQDPSTPSATVSAYLFGMTSQLANKPENEENLIKIGSSYGSYLYLMDAVNDYTSDMANGNYNPLRQFSAQEKGILTLSKEGIQWLFSRFTDLKNTIEKMTNQLKLYRYEGMINQLLFQPVNQNLVAISQLATCESDFKFERYGIGDIFQAAMFMSPFQTNNFSSSFLGDFLSFSMSGNNPNKDKGGGGASCEPDCDACCSGACEGMECG
jgi:Family of unknown function (DUF5685)